MSVTLKKSCNSHATTVNTALGVYFSVCADKLRRVERIAFDSPQLNCFNYGKTQY